MSKDGKFNFVDGLALGIVLTSIVCLTNCGKKADNAAWRGSGFLVGAKFFLIGGKVPIGLVWVQPVHHHLHAGGPAGVAAILAQVRHVDKDIGILDLPVIGWLNG